MENEKIAKHVLYSCYISVIKKFILHIHNNDIIQIINKIIK